ncbi:hypothetical protein [Streptomyces sp. H23]|uniref:hypothetical protein n=1 Tax=Streptomyces sp. H23 TaxID=2541723 RepID=UPI00106E097F|nr:hypothetical protein [Streptomyces sp. H23]
MSDVLILVGRPCASGGRRVTLRSGGGERVLGLAHSDHDVVVFLEAAGVFDPGEVLDDPQSVEWRGGRPHRWERP